MNSLVILILAALVVLVGPFEGVVEDLADFDPRIDPDGLHAKDLKRPEAPKADVAEARRDVNEKSQPADRRASLNHGDKVLRCREFKGPAQVEFSGFEEEALGWDGSAFKGVGLGHIEYRIAVDKKILTESQVVAVGVELGVVVGLDHDIASQPPLDF